MAIHRSLIDGVYSHELGSRVFSPRSLMDLSIEKINHIGMFQLSRDVSGQEFSVTIWKLTPETYKLLKALPLSKVTMSASVVEEMAKNNYQFTCEEVEVNVGWGTEKVNLSLLKQKDCFPNARKIDITCCNQTFSNESLNFSWPEIESLAVKVYFFFNRAPILECILRAFPSIRELTTEKVYVEVFNKLDHLEVLRMKGDNYSVGSLIPLCGKLQKIILSDVSFINESEANELVKQRGSCEIQMQSRFSNGTLIHSPLRPGMHPLTHTVEDSSGHCEYYECVDTPVTPE